MVKGPVPVAVVIRWTLQLAYGLAFAHKNGVVHGSLKPENVLIDRTGNVKISDFGVTRVTERAHDPSTTAPPVYVGRGNASYMAPEQLHRGQVSVAGDVYALGIMLYEMLTGTLPGRRSPMPSSTERVKKALGDRAIALDELFDKMTMDSLDQRHPSMDDVLDAFYKGFHKDDVHVRGTMLFFEADYASAPAPTPTADKVEKAEKPVKRTENTVVGPVPAAKPESATLKP
jgi:eukaryotic-like serine/threonine-protein kinase